MVTNPGTTGKIPCPEDTRKMSRLDDLFHVLKTIRRIVDNTHVLAERVIQETAKNRAHADEWLHGARTNARRSGPTCLHDLCRRVIDERELLAKELESILSAL